MTFKVMSYNIQERGGGRLSLLADAIRAQSPHVVALLEASDRPHDLVGVPPQGVQKRGDAVDGAARPAIQLLIDAGYVDCYRTLHPASPGYTYPTAHPWLRLDYIFASPEAASRLQSCKVVWGAKAADASDHFPVWAQFQWDGLFHAG